MKNLKKLFVLLLLGIVFTTTEVNAKEVYYVNDSGVEFTEEEYNFFEEFYYEGFQQYMTQELKDSFEDLDFATAEISKTGYCQGEKARGSSYQTQYRSIQIANSCGAICHLSTSVHWLVEPYTKSYDVIGYNLFGPTRVSTPTTVVIGDGDVYPAETTIYEDDGFGAVVKLPDAQEISLTQTFMYRGNGYVLSSYNHALRPISLENAKKFTIDLNGFSGVFDFYGVATDIYDEYPAVDLNV